MGNHFLDSFFFYGALPTQAETGTYIPLLVLASYLVAAFGSYAGLLIAGKLAEPLPPFKERLLHWMGAFAFGSGIWSMHFVGMLAYKMNMEVSYTPGLTLISMGIAIAAAYFVLQITKNKTHSRAKLSCCAVLLGLGICAMHYIGMAAMQMRAALHYQPSLFALSIVIAIVASGAALWIVAPTDKGRPNHSNKRQIIAAMILGAAICGAHYTAMTASVIVPYADCMPGENQSFLFLALSIVTVTMILVFILTFAASNRFLLIIGCGTLFALPLLVIVYQSVSALNNDIQNTRQERYGVYYHNKLVNLLMQAQELRSLTFAVDSGGKEFAETLELKQKAINEAIDAVDTVDATYRQELHVSETWQHVRELMQTALHPDENRSPMDGFSQYSIATGALISFIEDVADDTNLSTDPQVDSDYLANAAIRITPRILETIGRMRGLTTGLLAAGRQPQQWTEEENLQLRWLNDHLQIQDEQIQNALDRARRKNQGFARFIDYHSEAIKPSLEEFENYVKPILQTGSGEMQPLDTYNRGAKIATLYDLLYDSTTNAFLDLLQVREDEYELRRNLMLYSSTAAFLGFLALFFFLNRSLLRTENAQKIAMQAQDDLAHRLVEKERMEHQMQEYTDRLELSRFDIMAANTKLKEGEDKILAIVDNVLEGIITINEDGEMQTFNKAAEHVFGLSSQEAIGQKFGILLPEEFKEQYGERFIDHVRHEGSDHINPEREIMGQRKSGAKFPMVISISQVLVGKAPLYICLVRDITLQKEKEEDLRQTKERAEAANKTKSEFLANMSHELRTPLNSVLGTIHLMLGTKLTTEQEEFANTVLLSSTNLLEIVNDILDLSKIEAGEMALERIGFDPHLVFHTIVRALAHTAREKRVPIVRHYENETMPYLIGDPIRFGRIITNLLSNAVKYTDDGHIEVHAFTRPLDDKHTELRCEIIDTGIGIPKEKLDSVFEKFVQADTSTTRKYGGTGLGLAITRELVTLMGGKIGVDSEVGQGSTFWFTIPFEITDQLHQEKYIRQQKTLLGTVLPKDARILVAEDHPMNQLLIKQILGKFGIGTYEVVPNGVEALVAYQKSEWTAILMDCHMPEKNGYDTTIDIRELERLTKIHVPIVAMTANAMVGDKEKCLRSGMDEYVSKPINIEELKEVLSQWIAFDASAKKAQTAQMTQEIPAVDLTMLRTLTGGDIEIEKELMQTFVDQSDKNLVTLREHCSTEGENKPWTEAAHMLKGGSGSIGAETLRQLCSDAQLYKGDADGRFDLFVKIDKEYSRVKAHLVNEGLL